MKDYYINANTIAHHCVNVRPSPSQPCGAGTIGKFPTRCHHVLITLKAMWEPQQTLSLVTSCAVDDPRNVVVFWGEYGPPIYDILLHSLHLSVTESGT